MNDQPDNVIEDFHKEVEADFGSPEAVRKLIQWGQFNLSPEEWNSYHRLLDRGIFGVKIALAKLKIAFNQEYGEEAPTFKDDQINSFLNNRRQIQIVTSEETKRIYEGKIIDFAYTLGNDVQNPSLPEILTFWIKSETASLLLNDISNLLLEEIIKPLKEGEVIEVKGILGKAGSIPIRIKLLDESERDQIHCKYTCLTYSQAKIVLLEVPDLNGCFSIEDNCDPIIKENVPKELRLPSTSISLDLSTLFQQKN